MAVPDPRDGRDDHLRPADRRILRKRRQVGHRDEGTDWGSVWLWCLIAIPAAVLGGLWFGWDRLDGAAGAGAQIEAPPAASRQLAPGPAIRVIDGDTFEAGGRTIRLFGVVAPERGQSCEHGNRRWECGAAARRVLQARLEGAGAVHCEVRELDADGTELAVCRVDGNSDLGAMMVASGWAFANRGRSQAYDSVEAHARAARRGLWGAIRPRSARPEWR